MLAIYSGIAAISVSFVLFVAILGIVRMPTHQKGGTKLMQEKQLSPGFFTYAELQGMGNTVDDIVEKPSSLSADDISGYDSQDNESQYWLKHRRRQYVIVCLCYAG